MECDICMIEWDSVKRIPRLLGCGHTFCESCLISLLHSAKSKNTDIFCPNCMTKQREIQYDEDIKKLIKNFNLLRIVEKIEARKTVASQKSILGDRIATEENQIIQGNFSNNVPQPISQKKKVKTEPILKAEELNLMNIHQNQMMQVTEQKCKKHGLPVHSYAIGTNLLFCDKCVGETNLKTYPLPNVIKEIKRKIDSNQMRICLLKNEIERLTDFFDSYQ
jgi:hypothetical protein